jgi:hypothetical protein
MRPTTLLLLTITTLLSLTTAFPHPIHHSTSHQHLARHTRHTHISTTGIKTHSNPKIEPTDSKKSHTHNPKIAHMDTQKKERKDGKQDGEEGKGRVKRQVRDVLELVRRAVKGEDGVRVEEIGAWERALRVLGWQGGVMDS